MENKTKSKKIPTFEVPNLDEFHFGKVNWKILREHHVFHINRLEEARDKLTFPLPAHRKTVYDIIYITQGESIRSKGLNQYRIGQNECFFLPALQITAHESMSEDIKGYFLHFSPELFKNNQHLLKAFSILQFNTVPVVTIPQSEIVPILNIFERLLALYEKGIKDNLQVIEYYLLALFSEVSAFTKNTKEEYRNTASLITQEFKNALTQNIYTIRRVQTYAHILHVTPNHLNKCVKKTLDKTAQELLNEMCIMEAQSLLKYSNLSISQIAYQLFGSTPSNFSRFFKKHTGTSPSEFMNQ